MTPISTVARLLKDLGASRRGSILVYTGLALPVLIGAVGLSVDVAGWHVHRRAGQNMADSAAMAGALGALRTGAADVEDSATLAAAKNGFGDATNETLTIEYPPVSGNYIGSSDAVEVIYSRTVPAIFSQFLFQETTVVRARAVARAHIDDTCVWALNPSAQSTLKFSGGGQAAFNCGLMANSIDVSAVTQTGGGCVTATNVRVAGGYSGTCIQPTPLTGIKPIEDPFANLQPPTWSGCNYTNNFTANAGQTLVLSPGVYCGNISAISTGRIEFQPGLYILRNISVNFGGQSTVRGLGGTTFYMTASTSSSQTINIQAGANVRLKAPTTGPYAGMLFWQASGGTKVTHSFAGGANMDLDGIIYFPTQSINFSGGSLTDNSSSILIADTVNFTGQTYLGDFDGSAAAANPGLVRVALVE